MRNIILAGLWLLVAVGGLSPSSSAAAPAAAPPAGRWVASWGASPLSRATLSPGTKLPESFANQTLRQRVRLSLGGSQLRLRLSNEFGSAPIVIGAASVGLAGTGAAIEPGSLRTVTFGGSTSIVIPAGAPAESDPIDLRVDDLAELNVSLFLPEQTRADTLHSFEDRPAWIADGGDGTAQLDFTAPATALARFFLTRIDVLAGPAARTVVAFGDSITEGGKADSGWPSAFARRLAASSSTRGQIGVLNAGISGNRLREDGIGPSALARFDRDVLAIPGVTHVVVLEGINDLGFFGLTGTPLHIPSKIDAQDLIAAYQQLIARAHLRGIRIIGSTLTPFAGFTWLAGYYTPAKDRIREQVNRWIRTSGAFDAVIDFEATMRDPADPDRLSAKVDWGDHLHPSDAGMGIMADAVDLDLLGIGARQPRN